LKCKQFSNFECEEVIPLRFGRTIVVDGHWAGRPRLDHIDSKILSLFQENESHRVQLLAQALDVSLSTISTRLTDVLGFALRHTPWVSQFQV
jgi:AraC-like DNA-binding protein